MQPKHRHECGISPRRAHRIRAVSEIWSVHDAGTHLTAVQNAAVIAETGQIQSIDRKYE